MGERGTLDADAILTAAGVAPTSVDPAAPWVEGLHRVVAACNDEGGLSEAGAAAFSERLSTFAHERLAAEQLLADHPEARTRPVTARVVVTGMARSGTTVLQRLLGCDPDVAFLPTWQAFFPVPTGRCPPEEDPRRAAMAATVGMLSSGDAKSMAIHPTATDEPEEEVFLLQQSFASLLFGLQCAMPSYVNWLAATDQRHAYEFLCDLIRLNEWATDAPVGRPRVMKSPQFLFDLAWVLELMPGAVIAHTHRDPVELVGSYCSIYEHSRRRSVADLELHALGAERVDELEFIARRGTEVREAADPARFVDVQYTRLLADPLGVVDDIYTAMDVPFDPVARDAMLTWLADNPQGKGGRHEYSLDTYGLSADGIRRRFAWYTDRYGVTTG
jgi:hypothetical protein